MSIECGICERDLRGGHDEDCPRHHSKVITRLETELAAERSRKENWKLSAKAWRRMSLKRGVELQMWKRVIKRLGGCTCDNCLEFEQECATQERNK